MKKNRYKFQFGKRQLTLTTDKDNLFMEEIERVAKEKYQALKEEMPNADEETLAIVMAINCLSVQLGREIELEKIEKELADLRKERLKDSEGDESQLKEKED